MRTRTDQDQGLTALAADLEAIGVSRGIGGWMRVVPSVRMIAVALFRVSQSFGSVWMPLGVFVKQVNHVITGADVAWQAQIGPGVQMQHPTGVAIGPHTVLGPDVVIEQGVTIGVREGSAGATGSAVVGRGVLIGAGARILGPVVIGDHAKIGANAVVTKDVPAGATAVGVPARVIERRTDSQSAD